MHRSRPERTMHATIGKYLPDLVFGANDGIITTLAVVAGVVGAALTVEVILILGFANLLADGFSMGASNVLSRRSRADGSELVPLGVAGKHGLATFLGFVSAGLIPLASYLLPIPDGHRFTAAGALGLLTLFLVGAGRALFSTRRWLQAGLEMLSIGALAAGMAYAIGMAGAFLVGMAGPH